MHPRQYRDRLAKGYFMLLERRRPSLLVPSPRMGAGGASAEIDDELVPTDELLTAKLLAMLERAAKARKLPATFIVKSVLKISGEWKQTPDLQTP